MKTGGCPENCGYCPQAAEFDTGVKAEKLMEVEVVRAAQAAKDAGATRFCMGAAWRAPKTATLKSQRPDWRRERPGPADLRHAGHARIAPGAGAERRRAGLLQPQPGHRPEYYTDVVSTRAYQDRLDTLQNVRAAGISVCCGGIVGMGEAPVHRAGLIAQLANLQPYPESVPINSLVRVPGTPLADSEPIDPFDFVRVIAVARITMPRRAYACRPGASNGRGSAGAVLHGRGQLDFLRRQAAGDGNPDVDADVQLLAKLGLNGHRTTTTQDDHALAA